MEMQHPFLDRKILGVLANYVTAEDGTGCVHTAPGHGREDYQTGVQYGLDMYCPVGEAGEFTEGLAGVSWARRYSTPTSRSWSC